MATDYSNIHRAGVNNATGDSRALFLKLYAGEVLTAFQSKNIMMPLHRVRTISKGKSAQFPMTGKYRDAGYHTPGKEIVPTTARQGERIVSIDDLLINAQFIPNIDEAMSHFDIRSVYTQEAGFGLSKVADQNILRLAIKAALCETSAMAALATGAPMIQDYSAFADEDFTKNVVIGETAGATSDLNDARDPQLLAQAIMDAKRILVNANVPGDPFIVLSNDAYFDMFKIDGSNPLNSLAIFNRDIGGGGSPIAGAVPQILGMPIHVTNHLGSYASAAADAAWTSDLWTISGANVGEHKTGVATWGGEQPLAAATGSGRTLQYDTPSDNHDAWITNVTNNNATGATRITARVSAVANRVIGLVMTTDAVATAKLMDMSVESEYQINRQGTLMVAKYAMGHNVLRPACAVALIRGL